MLPHPEKSIADVLDMTVAQALEFFINFPRIKPKLETLRDVGLGYIRLGHGHVENVGDALFP